jgi:hypothetical protein
MTLPILCSPSGDDVFSTLAATFAPSDTVITVQTGDASRFGSPSPSAPIRVRVVAQSQVSGGILAISDPTKAATFRVTGRSGANLTGVTRESGTSQTFVSGDVVVVCVSRADLTDIHAFLRLGGPVNVMAAGGVKGDGVTDDGPAIQAIIDANAGRTIFFPLTQAPSAPSYYSTVPLNVTAAGTSLMGEGAGYAGGTIVGFAPGVTGINLAPSASGASVTDLVVDGGTAWEQVYPTQGVIPAGHTGSTLADAAAPTADGVRVGANLARLVNVVARNFARHGFNFSNQQCGGGAVSDNCTVVSCYALNNRGYGFYVQGGDSNAGTFSQCNASVNGLGGINDQSFLGNTWVSPKTDENHFDDASLGGYVPSCVYLGAIARASGTVTATLLSNYPCTAGQAIAAVVPRDTSFNGTFTVATASGTTITWAQAGANATPPVAAVPSVYSNATVVIPTPLAAISRASNVVTLTFAGLYPWTDAAGSFFHPGQGVTVTVPAGTGFSGTFIVATVAAIGGNTVLTYTQAGANATPSVVGASATGARMIDAWAAAGVLTGGAFITSTSTAQLCTLVNPYTEGGQSPDGSGDGGMQLGNGTTVLGGIYGTHIDFSYGTPGVYMGCVPAFSRPGFFGSFPSVYAGQDADFQTYEVVGTTGDHQSIRHRMSYLHLGESNQIYLWTDKEGPGGKYLYDGNPDVDLTSILRFGLTRGGDGATYLNSSGTGPVLLNKQSGGAGPPGTGGLQVGGPIACAAGNTAGRPTGVAVAGSMYFDTTLGKPIWYSGSAWRDATGTIV